MRDKFHLMQDPTITGELTNQLAGKLKSNMIKQDVIINIGLPMITQGFAAGHRVPGVTLCLPFRYKDSGFIVSVCLGNALREDTMVETDEFKIFITKNTKAA